MRKIILAALLGLCACDSPTPIQGLKDVQISDCVRIDIAYGGLARFCRWEPEPGVVCWVSSMRENISCVRKP